MEQQWRTSHLSGNSAAYVEDLFEQYLVDPNSVPVEWRDYFEKIPRSNGGTQDIPHSTIQEHFRLLAANADRVRPLAPTAVSSEHEKKQVRVLQLINAYRVRGHQKANLDPLGLMEREPVNDLDLGFHGLSPADFDTSFQTGSLFIGKEEATLREILDVCEETYCTTVGAEYAHIVDTGEKRWIQQRLESVRAHPILDKEERIHLLERLTAAEGLEKYLQAKFPGTKRFGLEGGESLIPLVDEAIQRAGSYNVKEIVIGMAHRGRLNVLVNTLGKNPAELIEEFMGKRLVADGSGDVKYHQGFSSNVLTPGGEVHLALAFNPSHLEIAAPVVEGSVRARQDRRQDRDGALVLPINLHGDAAFAGQGVVMETLQMSQIRGFKTGGTLHVIVNNQVGFTISKREDARSTEYCTDVAKMVQAPIFHVNADDPEAVFFVSKLAIDYRMQFRKDVVVDLICYRRRGHNEADEPASTQPLMYAKIRKHPTTREIYRDRLVKEGVLSEAEAEEMVGEYRELVETGKHVVKSLVTKPDKSMYVDWTPFLGHEWTAYADTSCDIKVLQELSHRLEDIPEGFVIQRQVAKIYDDRRKMSAGALPINWGYAEIMAYATCLHAGHPIRITGQDVGRGTFSHRHVVLHNQKDASTYVPLQHLSPDQPDFDIYDSFLSEEGVLAFEYGYSTTNPVGLVIWEAQFGDFANGAQVVIDQFISSGEHKWGRLCGLALFLPHGYEGQGPEHSSARLERYLQLCAEHNMQVCVPTTPAQVFHMIRRQTIRPLRKPLVVMTPKSLLRHKLAVSSLDELANGHFQAVLPETDAGVKPAKVKRVVLCSGKVYYDLYEKRAEEGITDVALVRIEQLYPFPEDVLIETLAPYKNLKSATWCQEEPQNQGAWYPSQHHMRRCLAEHNSKLYLEFAGRAPSAAAAAGYMSTHVEEQNRLVAEALGIA